MKKYGSFQIVVMGWCMVYIPCTVIILFIWYILGNFLAIDNTFSAIVGTVIGWVYWKFAITKWVQWAFAVGIEKAKILLLGRIALLLWNKSTVDKSFANPNK